jgi:hypothetical protein
MKKTFTKKYGTLLVLLLGSVVIVSLLAILFRDALFYEQMEIGEDTSTQKESQNLEVRMSQDTLEMNRGGLIQNLELFYGDRDVTQEAFWYSDDPTIASVANSEGIKGQISPTGEGETSITAVYQENGARASVRVVTPDVNVLCKGEPKVGRVGELVLFTGYYVEEGVPPYTYEWKTQEGEVFGNEGMAEKFFETPGEKTVSFGTMDMMGNFAETECSVVIQE